MGGASRPELHLPYLADAHGLSQAESGGAFGFMLSRQSVVSLLAIVPARACPIGRPEPVIYVCTALGAIGVRDHRRRAVIPFATIGSSIFGASQGTFLAVDWALMTDIIPRASSGRYMGLSNVVDGIVDDDRDHSRRAIDRRRKQSAGAGSGPRLEFLFGDVYILGALLLRPVAEPDRSVGVAGGGSDRGLTAAASRALAASSIAGEPWGRPSQVRTRRVARPALGPQRVEPGPPPASRSQPNGSGWRQRTGTRAHRKTM